MTFLDDILFRPADPETDLNYAYEVLFKPGIEDCICAQNNGIWPEDRFEFFKTGFARPGTMMISYDGDDIGCCSIREEGDTIVLGRVYIRPDYQGFGIGKKIIAMALDTAHQAHKPLELKVLANNHRAIHAYQKAGFVQSSPVLCVNGWEHKFSMRHRDTVQYLPIENVLGQSLTPAAMNMVREKNLTPQPV